MAENEPSAQADDDRKKQLVPSGISFALGVVSTAILLFDKLGEVVEKYLKAPPLAVGAAAVVFFVIAGTKLQAVLRRRSTLRSANQLRQRIAAQQMFGREDDLEKLITLCQRDTLIFVVGESGVGKTMLLEQGLAKELSSSRTVVYLDRWGRDPENGPMEELERAIRERADLDPPKKARLLRTLCPWIPTKSGQEAAGDQGEEQESVGKILLILDQFDEYQARHRERFIDEKHGTWIRPGALCAANTFWRSIRELLEKNAITCVIAERSDTATESIRFTTPQIYTVGRLREDGIKALLEKLTQSESGASLIAHPQDGWEQLREEIEDDLVDAGAGALPVRIKLALRGVCKLRSLTPREYARTGGLPGLEAGYVEGETGDVARRVDVPTTTALVILGKLAGEGTATNDLTVDEIVEKVADPSERIEQRWRKNVEALLKGLELGGLVRRRIDQDTTDKTEVWTLNHDFLAAAVRTAVARSENHYRSIERQKRQYEKAQGPIERWGKLLPPDEQLKAFFLFLGGKLRYGSLRGYAWLSTIRLLVDALVLVGVGILLFDGAIELMASHYLGRINSPPIAAIMRRSPRAIRGWVLKRVASAGGLADPKVYTLLMRYVASEPDKQRAVDELLIPCAVGGLSAPTTEVIENRSNCAKTALDMTSDKATTAAALAAAFWELASTTRTLIAQHIGQEPWRALAANVIRLSASNPDANREDKLFDLLTTDEPAQLDARIKLITDCIVEATNAQDVTHGGVLPTTIAVIKSIRRLRERPEEPIRKRLAGTLASDIHRCGGDDCGDAVQLLMQWFEDLEPTERTALERQLIKLAGSQGADGLTKLATVCARGWSPAEDTAELRESISQLISAEGAKAPDRFAFLASWACLADGARQEQRAERAKLAADELLKAPPAQLRLAIYAFAKLRSNIESDKRPKTWADIVRRLTDYETVQLLTTQTHDTEVLELALSGESPAARDEIVREFGTTIEKLIQTDPDPSRSIGWLAWFTAITKRELAADSPVLDNLLNAALARLDSAWSKGAVLSLSAALPFELRQKSANRLDEIALKALNEAATCTEVGDALSLFKSINKGTNCAGCRAAMDLLIQKATAGCACGEMQARVFYYKFPTELRWMAQHVATDQRLRLARLLMTEVCSTPSYTWLTWFQATITKSLCLDDTEACRRDADDIMKTGCTNPTTLRHALKEL